MSDAYQRHFEAILSVKAQERQIQAMAITIAQSLGSGGCLYICGNGGSAADAQHLAAEFVGRFKKDRPPLRALALTTDTSLLTAIANDYGYCAVFERQVRAFMRTNDVLLCISTSGNSESVVHAAHAAADLGAKVLFLSGRDGGLLETGSYLGVIIASQDTAAIQEAHLFIEHQLIELVEGLL